jgi:hypothetical protein
MYARNSELLEAVFSTRSAPRLHKESILSSQPLSVAQAFSATVGEMSAPPPLDAQPTSTKSVSSGS